MATACVGVKELLAFLNRMVVMLAFWPGAVSAQGKLRILQIFALNVPHENILWASVQSPKLGGRQLQFALAVN
jgi:hypothetical protein